MNKNQAKSPLNQHFSHFNSKPNDDLLNISLVSDADYTNRQIVRRKSNINGTAIEVIEASLLSIKPNKSTKTLILFTMDCTTKNAKTNCHRLILGPSNIK